ncbi:MAG: PIN/TRAM domain-containing protein [Planctomycetota bacterium]|nr:MAG: PIN/TRAM domain-containing protein [Planctomycetota bacterium]REJ91065.1 MAG: PIN/TRAM domain-containing protein [Planctomycetota bacterium]REK20847.1 MAG: PIN/TRAM domain-containing protein [Planctomycetota bacterium]REK36075.1 MAG: PIN/TRAM domain-containing protein [Planctomycetota bacterium]
MLLFVIRVVYILVCTGAAATYTLGQGTGAPKVVTDHPVTSFLVMLAIGLSALLIDVLIPRKRVEVASSIYIGLLIGVLLSYLFNLALRPLFAMHELFGSEGAAFQGGATLLTLIILPYLCITFLLQTRDDFRFVIPYVEFSRELKAGRPLILDSSALIDGRVADVIDTHMIDGQLLVPQFILQEVQDIADSHDKVRRSRGRRGLDVLKRIQSDPKVEVRIVESDAANGRSVDQRLIEISKQTNGRLVTNDLNLNKLAGVQGVPVVNLNDVSNALKPKFIPGEHVRIRLIKEGESPGQGVGYLDDGTMVVVESGSTEVGNEVDTVVTSVLQNSAGRMLFCRLALEEK